MGFHVQLDLKAIEQAPSVARAAGITLEQQIVGLTFMYHHVWTRKSDRATPALLMGWFAAAANQVARLVDAEIAYGHLAETDAPGVWRIRGAKRYFRLQAALSAGGKKSAGNLRQFQTPDGAKEAAPGKRTRALSAQEQCWGFLERARREHCVANGIEPGTPKDPTVVNKRINDAIEAAQLVDRIVDGEAYTCLDQLCALHERYLGELEFGTKDKEGNARVPPWPTELFLTPSVVRGYAQREREEATG